MIQKFQRILIHQQIVFREAKHLNTLSFQGHRVNLSSTR